MSMNLGLAIALIVLANIIGLCIGVGSLYYVPKLKAKKNEQSSAKIINDAEKKAENLLATAKAEAKATVQELKEDAEKEIKERKSTVVESEGKLDRREEALERRDQILLSKEDALEDKNEKLNLKIADLTTKEQAIQEKMDSVMGELERVSSMSIADAREEILKRVEDNMSKEIAMLIKTKEDEAEEVCDAKAKDLLSLAISKYSQDVTIERTISVVALPSDEMKGRIIGREGRNIRTLETLLGVDILIDDTPEAITVSCFNPIRREVARMSLEALIKDGRIQPGRIEQVIEKCQSEVDASIHKMGENVAFKLGLSRINKELLDFVGRLKYRTSYGQNALEHSIQVSYLTGIMAAELGLDQNLAKRAGLLHDIGKAADFEIDGSHVEIGARLARKYGEPDVVINAIESHHGDVEQKYAIATLVQAADTLSAARPGARRETLENYIKRIEQIETTCKSFEGVSNCFAMQSGREVRVIVYPDKVDDAGSIKLAHDIREKIENEMTYPGQIKVQVIREMRAIEIAK